ncbi:uncharacterized protein LOC110807530 [Carica papaya]|uniref:uncharacterized protein LOC110807530 n=1 Tax=Carica papaya TaxID=3649 RepID=UPI000B8CFE63|nr:uncharacterized protein LOC110807530 [Carica papaya]
MVRVWNPENHAGKGKRKAENSAGNKDETVIGDANCGGKTIGNIKRSDVDVNRDVNDEDNICEDSKGSAGTASRKYRVDATITCTRQVNDASSNGVKRSRRTTKIGKTALATRRTSMRKAA